MHCNRLQSSEPRALLHRLHLAGWLCSCCVTSPTSYLYYAVASVCRRRQRKADDFPSKAEMLDMKQNELPDVRHPTPKPFPWSGPVSCVTIHPEKHGLVTISARPL